MSALPARKTVVWHLEGNTWALYTGDPALAETAPKDGLRKMAEYYNLREDGKPVAWQFVGPKERVLAAAGNAAVTPAGEGGDGGEEPPASEAARARTLIRRKGQKGGAGTPQQLRLF